MTEANRARPTVLITGFGPYPKVRINPTAELARTVAASRRFGRLGLAAKSQIFETSYAHAGAAIGPALTNIEPVACLHLGLAPREHSIRIESRGENRTRALSPDVRGTRPRMRKLVPRAPEMIRSSVPLGPVLAGLKQAGVRSRISNDAGAYLCNAMYFWSLDAARQANDARAVLFIHIPRPAPAAGTVPKARLEGRAKRRSKGPSMMQLRRCLEQIAIRLAGSHTLREGTRRAD